MLVNISHARINRIFNPIVALTITPYLPWNNPYTNYLIAVM